MKKLSKEEKELLLKDLCARLPYDLQVNVEGDNEPYVLLSVHPNKDIALIGINMGGVYATSKVKIDTIKSYLRPMSSMTEEEKAMYEGLMIGTDNISYMLDVIDWFNKNHFDYLGLIPMGLALEAPKDMYN